VQLDQETMRWLFSGLFFAGGALISWLMGRQITQLDRDLTDHDLRIDANLQQINGIKQDFVSKAELEKQLNIQLSPIRDDMRELKGDVKALLQRP
jgi:hypothetical protein